MTAPTHTMLEADARRAWQQYRNGCFIRPGIAAAWIWAAGHDFDLAAPLMCLDAIKGVRVDLGELALALGLPDSNDASLHEWHVIPFVRMTDATLSALADAATFDPRTKARKIAQEQLQLQTVFDEEMKRANLWRMPNPGRMLHGLQ